MNWYDLWHSNTIALYICHDLYTWTTLKSVVGRSLTSIASWGEDLQFLEAKKLQAFKYVEAFRISPTMTTSRSARFASRRRATWLSSCFVTACSLSKRLKRIFWSSPRRSNVNICIHHDIVIIIIQENQTLQGKNLLLKHKMLTWLICFPAPAKLNTNRFVAIAFVDSNSSSDIMLPRKSAQATTISTIIRGVVQIILLTIQYCS